jgi:hypothetical protein
MRSRVSIAIVLAVAIGAQLTALALAAQPFKGRVYAGQTAHEKDFISATVSKNGKTVTLNIPALPLYCQGGGGPTTQVTKPARLSSTGAFTATIAYQAEGKTAFKAQIRGTFVKKGLIKGTVRSEYAAKDCNGSTTFSAKPASAL